MKNPRSREAWAPSIGDNARVGGALPSAREAVHGLATVGNSSAMRTQALARPFRPRIHLSVVWVSVGFSSFACGEQARDESLPQVMAPSASGPVAPNPASTHPTANPDGSSQAGAAPSASAPPSVSAQNPPSVAPSSGGGGSQSPSATSTSSDEMTETSSPGTSMAGAAGDESSSAPGASSGETGDGVTRPEGRIAIVGRELYVEGELFHIRGVNWNPIGRGQTHPDGLDFAGYADQDIALMKAAGINAVRTYERLEDRAVLDKLHEAGIAVFSTVYGWWQDDPSVVTERVNAVKDHPAILVWVIGNEWNYNHLYGGDNLSLQQTRDQLNRAAALIRAADAQRPISTIYGEFGSAGDGTQIELMLEAMPDIDIWGINAYRGIDHRALFDEWAAVSDKPMYLGEYGADAWDSRGAGQLNLDAQAEATRALTQQMMDRYTGLERAVTSGGFIFEWADEWWKDASGSPDVHDTGGVAPGGGPHPDQVFNEEFWGIVDIDRNPRPAYDALRELYAD